MNPRAADEVDFARVQGATTSSIVGKYGEEERRGSTELAEVRTRAKDTSMAREDSSRRP
jgi:hypothetical protein